MNNNIKNSLRLGIIAAAGAAAMVSCTDTWNDHFNSISGVDFDGTTMKAIEQEAPDFAAVIKAVGYDRELNSDNVYTIWAPKSFNKDSVLALAKTDSTAVVDRFIKNHIARYAISDDGTEQKIDLMSEKTTNMTAAKFGSANLVSGKTNMTCSNGVLHIIDKNINYQNNLFELIQANYDPTDSLQTKQGGSLYAFLQKWDKDSLDEKKSVSRGVDENGEKIWVDSVVIRNNTVLKNVDALLYEEDSSYIAIVPTAKAYQERYNAYKKLLVFNPSEDVKQAGVCDSLQNYYANMFAMTDLYFNKNANEHYQDSLKSTVYTSKTSPYNVYYMHDKKDQSAERPTHDILKGLTATDCSNGTGYIVDEYPMSITEQAFKKIEITPRSSQDLASTSDDKGIGLYTKNIASPIYKSGTLTDYEINKIYNEDSTVCTYDTIRKTGTRSYRFLDIPQSGSTNPYVSFYIPNILSGTYELYLVTCPIWAKTGFSNGECYEKDSRAYRFYTYVWERQNSGTKLGEYASKGTQLLNPSDGSKYFITNPENKIDTLYLGDYTFSNTYYARGTTEQLSGAMIQFVVQITSKLVNTYSREMLFSNVILKPKAEALEQESATESKRRK